MKRWKLDGKKWKFALRKHQLFTVYGINEEICDMCSMYDHGGPTRRGPEWIIKRLQRGKYCKLLRSVWLFDFVTGSIGLNIIWHPTSKSSKLWSMNMIINYSTSTLHIHSLSLTTNFSSQSLNSVFILIFSLSLRERLSEEKSEKCGDVHSERESFECPQLCIPEIWLVKIAR